MRRLTRYTVEGLYRFDVPLLLLWANVGAVAFLLLLNAVAGSRRGLVSAHIDRWASRMEEVGGGGRSKRRRAARRDVLMEVPGTEFITKSKAFSRCVAIRVRQSAPDDEHNSIHSRHTPSPGVRQRPSLPCRRRRRMSRKENIVQNLHTNLQGKLVSTSKRKRKQEEQAPKGPGVYLVYPGRNLLRSNPMHST